MTTPRITRGTSAQPSAAVSSASAPARPTGATAAPDLPLRTSTSSSVAPRSAAPAKTWPKVHPPFRRTPEVSAEFSEAQRLRMAALKEARMAELDTLYLPRDERAPTFPPDTVSPRSGDDASRRSSPAMASDRSDSGSAESEGWITPAVAAKLMHLFDEVPFHGYVYGVQVDEGRRVEGEEYAELRDANDTAMSTRAILHYGRGNVAVDNEATAGETFARIRCAREIADAFARRYHRDEATLLEQTAGAVFAAAGNCGEHTYVAALEHASKLKPGETVTVMESHRVDHAWATVTTASGATNIVDTWCDGPAVHVRHSRYGRFAFTMRAWERWNAENGPIATTSAMALARRVGDTPASQAHLTALIDECRSKPVPRSNRLPSEPVIRKSFARRVAKKMSEPIPLRTACNHVSPEPTTPERNKLAAMKHRVSDALNKDARSARAAEDQFASLQAGVRHTIKILGMARSRGLAQGVAQSAALSSAIHAAAMDLRRPRRTGQVKQTLAALSAHDEPGEAP